MRDLPDAPLAAPLLETRGLSFRSGGATLLSDISLTISPGQTTVLLGPNGAGKSLLLRLLHGLLPPSSGSITFADAPLTAAARKSQALVPQRPVLLRRSVRGNLAFALARTPLSRPARARRIDEILHAARLAHLASHPARRLSGGEQQRLALARALAFSPRLLLLDEPTASLDPASTAAIETQLGLAKAAGCTLILVTHDAGQARRLGDRLAFLCDGRLRETGPLASTIAAPQTPEFRAWLEGRIWSPTAQACTPQIPAR